MHIHFVKKQNIHVNTILSCSVKGQLNESAQIIDPCRHAFHLERSKILMFSKGQTLWSILYENGKEGTCINKGQLAQSLKSILGRNILLLVNFLHLTLSQTTYFRLFQTETVCRRQFQI